MRKHAFLKENIVVKVESITEEQYIELIREYQNIIDVEDLIVTPSIGYVLSGSMLVPPAGQIVSLKEIIMGKITQYRESAPQLLTELYAENTLAGLTVSQSDALFDSYGDVIFRLKEGAFPSALYRLSQKTPSGFVTQALIDKWHDRIVEKMI
jgi:hypothetical protein